MSREFIEESGIESGLPKEIKFHVPEEIAVLTDFDPTLLKKESQKIINQLVKENDPNKVKDLTYLFNVNQNKKTMARQNKLNDVMDVIIEQALDRFTKKPDEIANKELLESMKVVNDLITQGQKQVNDPQKPLIQINQQEVNVGTDKQLTRESKERVQNAVLKLLNGMNKLNEEEKKKEYNIIDADTTKKEE